MWLKPWVEKAFSAHLDLLDNTSRTIIKLGDVQESQAQTITKIGETQDKQASIQLQALEQLKLQGQNHEHVKMILADQHKLTIGVVQSIDERVTRIENQLKDQTGGHLRKHRDPNSQGQ